ncbi:MAG: VWA domain-containing protein [Deltaproteobacteria bacterium]|nr:VWA domain-containing protein [Deltaproteobacteria bacterium]
MNKRSASLICTAGTLAAATSFPHGHASAQARAPLQVAVETCGDAAAPSQKQVEYGHGTFSAALSGEKVLADGSRDLHVAITLDARPATTTHRPPLNLAIVVDRSGSMAGEKIQHARSAAQGILARLAPMDRAALVQYDDTAQVLAPLTPMDEQGKQRLGAAIDGIQDAGGTNLHGGLALGRDEVARDLSSGRINRVILLSDGRANVGITDLPTLSKVASQAAHKGIRITTVGLGLDYNEDLMEALAENGRGQYYYVRDAAALERVFAGELAAMQATVATNAELRLSPACQGIEISAVPGYEIRREGNEVVIPLADLFGGDRRKVVARVRLHQKQAGRTGVLSARLVYNDAKGGARKQSTLALGVEVSRDALAVTASVNKDVATKVAQVESAEVMRKAAEAYDRGDSAGAVKMLKEQRQKVEQEAIRMALPAAAAQPLYDELDGMKVGVSASAPSSAAGKDIIKGSKAKSRALSK